MPWIECEERSNWQYSDYEYQMTCRSLALVFEQLADRDFTEARSEQLNYLLLKEAALRPKVWKVK